MPPCRENRGMLRTSKYHSFLVLHTAGATDRRSRRFITECYAQRPLLVQVGHEVELPRTPRVLLASEGPAPIEVLCWWGTPTGLRRAGQKAGRRGSSTSEVHHLGNMTGERACHVEGCAARPAREAGPSCRLPPRPELGAQLIQFRTGGVHVQPAVLAEARQAAPVTGDRVGRVREGDHV